MPLHLDIVNFLVTNEPSKELKIILIIHFILTVFGSFGSFAPISYLFYNLPIILLLLWSIYDRKNVEPLRLVMALELTAAIIDAFYFGVDIDVRNHDLFSRFKGHFSAVMICLQLICRPFVIVYLLMTNDIQENLLPVADYERDDYDKPENDLIEKNPFENQYSEIASKVTKNTVSVYDPTIPADNA